MKHAIGTYAKVLQSKDETMDPNWMGKIVRVVAHNTNGMSGNTEKNPLHLCEMVNEDNGIDESFWYEELKPIS